MSLEKIGLVLPASFTAFTKKKKTATDGELHQRQLKLTHLTFKHEPSSTQRMYPCKTSGINTLDV